MMRHLHCWAATLLMLLVLLLGVRRGEAEPETITLVLSKQDDDAVEQAEDGRVSVEGNELGLGDHVVGLRFPAAGVPPGMFVLDARVHFTASRGSEGLANVLVRGSPDKSRFLNQNNNLSERPKTSEAVTWEILSPWQENENIATPNIAAVVQELVDATDYDAAEPLVLLFMAPLPRVMGRVAYSATQDGPSPRLELRFDTTALPTLSPTPSPTPSPSASSTPPVGSLPPLPGTSPAPEGSTTTPSLPTTAGLDAATIGGSVAASVGGLGLLIAGGLLLRRQQRRQRGESEASQTLVISQVKEVSKLTQPTKKRTSVMLEAAALSQDQIAAFV